LYERKLDLLLTTNYVSVISKPINPKNVLHLILTADNCGLHHPEYADIQGKTLQNVAHTCQKTFQTNHH